MAMTMDSPRKKRSIIPYYFVAFFLVVFTANMIMVYIALTSWTGLETKNHYVKGLKYNEALTAAARQAALGWSAGIGVELSSGTAGLITIDLGDRESRPLTGARVSVKVIRPTHHGYDQTLPMSETLPGKYQSAVEFPLSGNWDVKVIVQRGEDSFQLVERIFVKDGAVE